MTEPAPYDANLAEFLLVPIAEEALFRGFLLAVLLRSLRRLLTIERRAAVAAVVISALAFGTGHLGNLGYVPADFLAIQVVAASLFGVPGLAAALSVPLAILVMSLARCLHPPGGAVALLAATSGVALPLPIAAGSILLVGVAWAFHRVSGHAYPHRPDPVAARRELAAEGLIPDDLDRALADLHETFDISREDLALLLARAEHHAAERRERTAP